VDATAYPYRDIDFVLFRMNQNIKPA